MTCVHADGRYRRRMEHERSTPAGVRVADDGPVRVITIDRPDRRNAVDSHTAAVLLDTFVAFDDDDALHVAVLTGAGGVFCAGADLKALADGDRRPVSDDGPGPMGPTRLRLTKPVIAAIEGPAVAGGLELALWCDLRVVAEDAVLGVYCRRFGVPLVDLGTVRLPRLIGHSRAMDLMLTGRGIDGVEAERIGLANRVVERGGALAAAVALAHDLASLPQRCMRNDRLSAIEQWDLDEVAATRNEAVRGRDTIASGETLAGAARFAAGAGRGGTPITPIGRPEDDR
jgi:enoyl-CoA hydratase